MFPSFARYGGFGGFLGLRPTVVAGPAFLSDLDSGSQRHPDTCGVSYRNLRAVTTPIGWPTGIYDLVGARVALIGGGISNAIAAYELSQAHIPFRLFEAGPQVGGRLTGLALDDAPTDLTGVRLPPRALTWHYVAAWADSVGYLDSRVQLQPFPLPGTVPTLVSLQGSTYELGADFDVWVPNLSGEAAHLFRTFCNNLNDGRPAPDTVYLPDVVTVLKQDPHSVDSHRVVSFWRAMIDRYDGRSLGDVLRREAFAGGSDLESLVASFATFGVGGGPFGPFFDAAFLEVLRLLLWDIPAEYRLPDPATYPKLAGGVQGLAEGLLALAHENGVRFGDDVPYDEMVRVNATVGSVLVSDDKVHVTLVQDGRPMTELFDYAIVGTSTTAMQAAALGIGQPNSPLNVPEGADETTRAILTSTRAAIHQLSTTPGYQMYASIASPESTPDWPVSKKDGQPVRCFLTDNLARTTYVLPTPTGSPTTLALVSEARGADASKFSAYDAKQRQHAVAQSYLYGEPVDPTQQWDLAPLGRNILRSDQVVDRDWSTMWGVGGGYRVDGPQDNYVSNSLAYHYRIARSRGRTTGPGARVFFGGERASHLGWIEGAAMAAVNAVTAIGGELEVAALNGFTLDPRMRVLLEDDVMPFHQWQDITAVSPPQEGVVRLTRRADWSGDPRVPGRWRASSTLDVGLSSGTLSRIAVTPDGNQLLCVVEGRVMYQWKTNEPDVWSPLAPLPGTEGMLNPLDVSIGAFYAQAGTPMFTHVLVVDAAGSLWHTNAEAGLPWGGFHQPFATEKFTAAAIATEGFAAAQLAAGDTAGWLRHAVWSSGQWSALGKVPKGFGEDDWSASHCAVACTGSDTDKTTVMFVDPQDGGVYQMVRSSDGTWAPYTVAPITSPQYPYPFPRATRIAALNLSQKRDGQVVFETVDGDVYLGVRFPAADPVHDDWDIRPVPLDLGGGESVSSLGLAVARPVPGVPPMTSQVWASRTRRTSGDSPG